MTQPEETTRGNAFTAKVGPLPAWGWIAIAAAGGIGVLLWLQNRRGKQQPTNTTDVQGVDSATLNNFEDALATIEAQIRDLQGAGSQPTPGGGGGLTPGGPTPPPVTPPSNDQPPPSHRPIGHTLVIDGKNLQELLNFYGMTAEQLWTLNPGLQGSVRWYTPGKGYSPTNTYTPGAQQVLDVGQPRTVAVYGGG